MIRWPEDRTPVLASLALTAAGRGHLGHARRLAADAERTAGAIRHPGVRAKALAALAPAIAALGNLDRAEHICKTITAISSDERARALTEIAEFADKPSAHRLLGEAFAIGSWLVPLPALTKLRPDIVVRIADGRPEHRRSTNAADGA
jgi:hypothetical protein